MNPEDQTLLTLFRRTKKNLDYIEEQQKKGIKVYEYTQLLNSMLSMLILMREKYIKDNHVSWEEIEQLGISVSARFKSKHTSFNRLISDMRHAFAHNYFNLLGRPDITEIELWLPKNEDEEEKDTNRKWGNKFSKTDLEEIISMLYSYVEQISS